MPRSSDRARKQLRLGRVRQGRGVEDEVVGDPRRVVRPSRKELVALCRRQSREGGERIRRIDQVERVGAGAERQMVSSAERSKPSALIRAKGGGAVGSCIDVDDRLGAGREVGGDDRADARPPRPIASAESRRSWGVIMIDVLVQEDIESLGVYRYSDRYSQEHGGNFPGFRRLNRQLDLGRARRAGGHLGPESLPEVGRAETIVEHPRIPDETGHGVLGGLDQFRSGLDRALRSEAGRSTDTRRRRMDAIP